MKLSIVVPVYKVEPFLDKCIASILTQTFSDFELILVDDGSPDRCGEMCENWARKDSRIRVIHKENGGLSDARNAGIEIAKGEYIGFVDSDDYIKPDMYEVLVENMEKYNADISMCGYADVYSTGVRKESDDTQVYVWDRKEAIRQILLGKLLSVHAWVKLYNRKLFVHIKYPKGKISEDAYVIMSLMEQVNVAVFTPKVEYYYVHRNDSINTSRYKEIDLTRIEAHKRNYDFIKKNYPDLGQLAFDRYIGAIAFVVHKIAMSKEISSDKKKNSLTMILRKNLANVYMSEYFSRKRKLSITLLVINKSMYRGIMHFLYRNTR